MPRSESPSSSKNIRLAVIGAGIIGLSCAVESANRGASVTIFDAGLPGRGASWAAAGMLSPAFEVGLEIDSHSELLDLCLQSASMWPEFAANIETQSGRGVGYDVGPSLAVARNQTDENVLARIERKLKINALPCHRLDAHQLLELAPELTGSLRTGLRLPTDGSVDNRRLIEALVAICTRQPRIEMKAHTQITEPEALLPEYDAVLCTAGWRSGEIVRGASDVGPVAGQLLSVATYDGAPKQTIRFGSTYIAPKQDRIIIGATVERGAIIERPEAAVIDNLLQQAVEVCPGIGNSSVLDSWVGIRPGSPDNAPLIGACDQTGIYMATGHFRNGVLLAPVTAKMVVDEIEGCGSGERLNPFSPQRFLTVSI